MKTKKQTGEKSSLEILREIRDNVNSEIQNMDFNQIREFLKDRTSSHNASGWKSKFIPTK